MEPETPITPSEDGRSVSSGCPNVAEFRRRLAHLDSSFRAARRYEELFGTFNSGVSNLMHAVNPRAKRWRHKVRLHPVLEIAVSQLWLEHWSKTGEEQRRDPTADEILDVCRKFAARLKPLRGRPADGTLIHHVHGLMALVQGYGSPAIVSRTRDSVYDPHVASPGGRIVEMIIQEADPSVSSTALVNVILDAHASGAIEGKRFRDFFPFYGGQLDPATGRPVLAPGFQLACFEPSYPIYCS